MHRIEPESALLAFILYILSIFVNFLVYFGTARHGSGGPYERTPRCFIPEHSSEKRPHLFIVSMPRLDTSEDKDAPLMRLVDPVRDDFDNLRKPDDKIVETFDSRRQYAQIRVLSLNAFSTAGRPIG